MACAPTCMLPYGLANQIYEKPVGAHLWKLCSQFVMPHIDCVAASYVRHRTALVVHSAIMSLPVSATPVASDSNSAPAVVANCTFIYECQAYDNPIPNIHCAVCKNETAYVHRRTGCRVVCARAARSPRRFSQLFRGLHSRSSQVRMNAE